ncbi:MAG: pentapeptide repeat-containing protein [Chloroflexota bacterium]
MTITEVKTSENWLDRFNNRLRRVMNYVLEVRRVGVILLVLSLASGIYGYSVQHRQPDGSINWNWGEFIRDYYANISSELGSVAITVLIIDYLNDRRQREEEKQRLIRQMGSTERGLAMAAVEELKASGAIKDGSLIGVNLEEAKLSGVRMGRADVRHARMDFADLSGAHLYFANMERADMSGSDLRGTVLTGANLRHADVVAAKLQGALLSEADLTHCKIDRAIFDETTQLPDKSNWSRKTDMRRFTDPHHPEYWRSEMPESPAFNAKRS